MTPQLYERHQAKAKRERPYRMHRIDLPMTMIMCPECHRRVETRPSKCDCISCQSIMCFVHHMYKGAKCFGSGHGVKRGK
jgi:hypothetical protein